MVCTKDSNNKVFVGRTNLAGDILATFQSEHEGIEKRFKLLLAVSDRVALSVT